ncbi:MAG: hypothetical protein QM730_19160 [Anaerolineales bacterium]
MNRYQDEINAEYHRNQIVKEIEQIKLEKLAYQSRVYQPTVFTRSMFNLANWMISTGKQLRRRYEMPVVQHNRATSSMTR